jgi:hypothetical protein
MSESIEARAFEAIARHPQKQRLVALASAAALRMAESMEVAWQKSAAAEGDGEAPADATGSETTTPGATIADLEAILEHGPRTQDDRGLLRALWAHALADGAAGAADDALLVRRVLWLATCTPFDATTLLDRALGERADGFWPALGDRLRALDSGDADSRSRAEAIAAMVALRTSTSTGAAEALRRVGPALNDPVLAGLVAGDREAEVSLSGELVTPPRPPLRTVALALTGLLFVVASARTVARVGLGYRRPAEVNLTRTSVRIRWRTVILGRSLREHDVVLARQGLARAARQVRYPRAGLYAGLLSLALGSLVGVRTFLDGVRAASPSLLFWGLAVVGAGIGLDFVLSSVGSTRSGVCRVLLVGRDGTAFAVDDVNTTDTDRALGALASSTT